MVFGAEITAEKTTTTTTDFRYSIYEAEQSRGSASFFTIGNQILIAGKLIYLSLVCIPSNIQKCSPSQLFHVRSFNSSYGLEPPIFT